MARILVSGASGLIGEPLTLFLQSHGHSIVRLVRPGDPRTPNSILWDPEKKLASLSDFEGFDAVIHLAGEPLSLSRWNRAKKEKIMNSRKEGTSFLVHLIRSVKTPPKVFLSASAVGFYGDRGDELLTEESGKGEGFLADVCEAWEKASQPLASIGVRVIQARFGMVLGQDGGALKKMIIPFRLGLGGTFGSGHQWVSWIALDDLISAIDHLLFHSDLHGAVNLVSPYLVRQNEFAQILSQCLHRKTFLWVPAFVLRLIFGEAADGLILASARVSPDKILASNFAFRYSDLRSALFQALKMTS